MDQETERQFIMEHRGQINTGQSPSWDQAVVHVDEQRIRVTANQLDVFSCDRSDVRIDFDTGTDGVVGLVSAQRTLWFKPDHLDAFRSDVSASAIITDERELSQLSPPSRPSVPPPAPPASFEGAVYSSSNDEWVPAVLHIDDAWVRVETNGFEIFASDRKATKFDFGVRPDMVKVVEGDNHLWFSGGDLRGLQPHILGVPTPSPEGVPTPPPPPVAMSIGKAPSSRTAASRPIVDETSNVPVSLQPYKPVMHLAGLVFAVTTLAVLPLLYYVSSSLEAVTNGLLKVNLFRMALGSLAHAFGGGLQASATATAFNMNAVTVTASVRYLPVLAVVACIGAVLYYMHRYRDAVPSPLQGGLGVGAVALVGGMFSHTHLEGLPDIGGLLESILPFGSGLSFDVTVGVGGVVLPAALAAVTVWATLTYGERILAFLADANRKIQPQKKLLIRVGALIYAFPVMSMFLLAMDDSLLEEVGGAGTAALLLALIAAVPNLWLLLIAHAWPALQYSIGSGQSDAQPLALAVVLSVVGTAVVIYKGLLIKIMPGIRAASLKSYALAGAALGVVAFVLSAVMARVTERGFVELMGAAPLGPKGTFWFVGNLLGAAAIWAGVSTLIGWTEKRKALSN